MTFLYPSFLWALAALAIPILIHLFNFRRVKRVYFSNTKFLQRVKEVTTAKRRIKHLLILAARLLFLFFLVIAFTQPLIPAREQLAAERSVVLYIDNSQSMSAQMADKSRGLEAALRFAQNIVATFPTDTRYKVITNDFAPFSNTFKTKPEAADLLAEIRLSPLSRAMDEIRNKINQDVTRDKDIFWISDFQKSTLGSVPDKWDSAERLHLVPIKFQTLPNVFVDTASLENPFAASGEKNVLSVRLRNDGAASADDLNIKLTINDVQSGTAQVSVPAKGSSVASFDLASGLRGRNKAMISFTDFPVSFDNEFYLALNFTDKINIIEIKDQKTKTSVETVYGNQQVFNFKSFHVGNVNYNQLNEADLVIVNGLNKVESSLTFALRNYLQERAGSLLIIPGLNIDLQSYQQLTGLSLSNTNISEQTELDKPDFANPFFENIFEEKSTSIAMPKAASIVTWSDRSAILRFKNDQPFLSRFKQGGDLYILSAPLQESNTDFYNHALFVPVFYRIAATSRKEQQRLYYSVQQDFISLRVDSLTNESVKLAGKQEFIPSQRKVNNQLLMDIPKFSIEPGFYHVVAGGDSLSLVAFNLDKKESLLDQYNGNEIKNQMGNGSNITIFEAESEEALSTEIRERYLGKPLWKYAVMLALLFLLAEVLLIRLLK
ncbi:MAG TPA: BatA and WFA domain-containing protein [Chryseosolibacter sp.]|nr:BatA and WFA domain-containing protein [Chryseosolibacter sp.]